MGKWTKFWDMNSGGGLKEKWSLIFIEATEDEAKVIFYNRFGHNPDRVSCTCCGPDYSITEYSDLLQATGYHRGCACPKDEYIEEPTREPWSRLYPYQTLAVFRKRKDVLIIPAGKIKTSERKGNLSQQGYVWVD